MKKIKIMIIITTIQLLISCTPYYPGKKTARYNPVYIPKTQTINKEVSLAFENAIPSNYYETNRQLSVDYNYSKRWEYLTLGVSSNVYFGNHTVSTYYENLDSSLHVGHGYLGLAVDGFSSLGYDFGPVATGLVVRAGTFAEMGQYAQFRERIGDTEAGLMNGNFDFLVAAGMYINGDISDNLTLSLQSYVGISNLSHDSFSVQYKQHRVWLATCIFWLLDHPSRHLPIRVGYGFSL